MSPKVNRQSTPDEEDKSGLERKSSLSLRLRSNSLRGSLRKHKTHEAPCSAEEENFKKEWGISPAKEVGLGGIANDLQVKERTELQYLDYVILQILKRFQRSTLEVLSQHKHFASHFARQG